MFPHKVVAKVDEMGLFHQLGYEIGERGWQQSTVALLPSLQETSQVLGPLGPLELPYESKLRLTVSLGWYYPRRSPSRRRHQQRNYIHSISAVSSIGGLGFDHEEVER
jgi:hypothetical protein